MDCLTKCLKDISSHGIQWLEDMNKKYLLKRIYNALMDDLIQGVVDKVDELSSQGKKIKNYFSQVDLICVTQY